MNAAKKQNNMRIIFTCITVIITLFIFSQSCLPAKASGNESSFVMDFLNSITSFLGLGNIFTAHFIRKFAHFTEFAVLGTSLRITLSLYNLKLLSGFVYTAIGCLSVAICDESIQLLSPGRACSVNDVLLDFTGSLCALAFVSLIMYLRSRNADKLENHDKNRR